MSETDGIRYVWDEVRLYEGTRVCHTDLGRALNDPSTYYGGRKRPVVLRWGEIERALSDAAGLYEASTFTNEYSDADYAFRTAHAARSFAGALVVERAATETERAAAASVPTLARGLVQRALALGGRRFQLVAGDVVAHHFVVGASDERQIPRRRLSTTQFADLPAAMVGKAEPIIYGAVTDEAAASPRGLVPVLHVGTEEISGATWQRFLVAGHACKLVADLFVDDVAVAAGSYGVTWFAPGKASWPFAAVYRDLAFRRYTLVYGRGPEADAVVAGSSVLTANVQGIEDVGDGTGTLINSLPLQECHFLQNFGFADTSYPDGWGTGAWRLGPVFPADPAPDFGLTVRHVDAAAFTAAHNVLEAHAVGATTGGGIIGNKGALLDLRQVLAWFHVAGGYEVGINAASQFGAWAFDERTASYDTAVRLTEAVEIDADSFSIDELDAEHWNAIPYVYGYDWAREAWVGQDEDADTDSIDHYGVERRAPLREFWFVQDSRVAADCITRALARSAYPPRRARLRTGAVGLTLELGDPVLVTHGDGVGAAGWVDEPCRVVRHVAQPGMMGAELVVEDVGDRLVGT